MVEPGGRPFAPPREIRVVGARSTRTARRVPLRRQVCGHDVGAELELVAGVVAGELSIDFDGLVGLRGDVVLEVAAREAGRDRAGQNARRAAGPGGVVVDLESNRARIVRGL